MWVVEHHASFQMVYYAHFYGWDQHEREKYRDSIYFQSCADFCERWDQSSFDPHYESEPLAFFEPYVRRLFARKPYDPAIMQVGFVKGLPRSTSRRMLSGAARPWCGAPSTSTMVAWAGTSPALTILWGRSAVIAERFACLQLAGFLADAHLELTGDQI